MEGGGGVRGPGFCGKDQVRISDEFNDFETPVVDAEFIREAYAGQVR